MDGFILSPKANGSSKSVLSHSNSIETNTTRLGSHPWFPARQSRDILSSQSIRFASCLILHFRKVQVPLMDMDRASQHSSMSGAGGPKTVSIS